MGNDGIVVFAWEILRGIKVYLWRFYTTEWNWTVVYLLLTINYANFIHHYVDVII